jgi:hypothetical protein
MDQAGLITAMLFLSRITSVTKYRVTPLTKYRDEKSPPSAVISADAPLRPGSGGGGSTAAPRTGSAPRSCAAHEHKAGRTLLLLLGRDVDALRTKVGMERAVGKLGFLEGAPNGPPPLRIVKQRPRIDGGSSAD